MKMGRLDNCRVNKRLLPVKLHYLIFFASLACVLPFRTVFAKQLGISGTEVGVIFFAFPFIKIITNPIIGFILDYFKRFRLTMAIMIILAAISFFVVVFIPPKSTAHQDFKLKENELRTKLIFLSDDETVTNSGSHRLTVYNDYRTSDNSLEFLLGRKSFVCDMHCSEIKSLNATTVNNSSDVPHYDPNLTLELNLFVDISECDIDVRIDNERVHIIDNDVRNIMTINSSARSSISSVFSAGNCATEKSNQGSNGSKQSGAVNLHDKVKKHASIDEQHKVNSESTVYYVQHEYPIDTLPVRFVDNRFYAAEFDCKAKNCFPTRNINLTESSVANDDEFLSPQFWSLFVLLCISSATITAIIFMADVVCYELLQDRKDLYGQQRLYGTAGWGLGALVGGYLNQLILTDSGQTDYRLSFSLLLVLLIVDLYPVYQLKVTDLKYSPDIMKDVCGLFTRAGIVYNIIIALTVGILSGFIWNYQFWFMQEIGSSQVLLGLSMTVECIFELPFFVISGWIINKIGHAHCNNITLLCFGLRYLCFAYMYDPWWTLGAGLLHGPTFGMFYPSLTFYAKTSAPPGTEATVQSLMHLAFEGVGVAIGSMLGGVGFDKLGSRKSFMYAAGLSFLMLFINLVATGLFLRTEKKSKQVELRITCS